MTKPVAPHKEGLGFFNFLAVTILVVSLIGWGAAYAYKSLVAQDVANLEASLAKAKEAFEPGLLKTFENLDRRLRTGELLLSEHTSLTPLFATLDELTLKSVRYNKFSLLSNTSGTAAKVSGEALNFPAIALQALAFSKDGRLQNPIFSNLGVQPTGRVTFDVAFTVSPDTVLYSPKSESQLHGL